MVYNYNTSMTPETAAQFLERGLSRLSKIENEIKKGDMTSRQITRFTDKQNETINKIQQVIEVLQNPQFAAEQPGLYQNLNSKLVEYRERVILLNDLLSEKNLPHLKEAITKIMRLWPQFLPIQQASLQEAKASSSSTSTSSPAKAAAASYKQLSLLAPSFQLSKNLSTAAIQSILQQALHSSQKKRKELLTSLNEMQELRNAIEGIETFIKELQQELQQALQIEGQINTITAEIENEIEHIKLPYNELGMTRQEFSEEFSIDPQKQLGRVKQALLQPTPENETKLEKASKKSKGGLLGLFKKKKTANPSSANKDVASSQARLNALSALDALEQLVQKRTENEKTLSLVLKTIREKVETVQQTLRQLGINLENFTKLDRDTDLVSFQIFFEKRVNKIVNPRIFQAQLTQFVDENKALIVLELRKFTFSPELQIRLERVEAIDEAAETHNGGKKPFKITLKIAGQEDLCFVCKPREARIDEEILKLFAVVNDQKPWNARRLPTYKIIHPDSNWSNFDQIKPLSIWEYVRGTNLKKLMTHPSQTNPNKMIAPPDSKTAQDFINDSYFLNKRLDRLRSHLKAMNVPLELIETKAQAINQKMSEELQALLVEIDALLTETEITDQHLENLLYDENLEGIFSAEDVAISQNVVSLTPVDLESREHRASDKGRPFSTQLGSDNEKLNAMQTSLKRNSIIKKAISTTCDTCSNYPTRLVLIGTDTFYPALTYQWQSKKVLENSINRLLDSLGRNVKTLRTYKLADEPQKISERFVQGYLEDLLNDDVPYFTEHAGVVYYGLPSRNMPLFQRINHSTQNE